MEVGPQYSHDDEFKAAARLHQSRYRAEVLKVGYSEYGNRLTDADARALRNYFDGLGVREAVRRRYPVFSATRDTDMLRSEHMPFNLFAPLVGRPGLGSEVIFWMTGVRLASGPEIRFEWAPTPARGYLDDKTSFDAYFSGLDERGLRLGVGVEVKYTERGYRMGKSEAARVEDDDSTYWVVTRGSGAFRSGGRTELATDELRQIWRNHLLGLAMVRRGHLDRFISVTIYPAGNRHLELALPRYGARLERNAARSIVGVTFEDYVSWLPGNDEFSAWKNYLADRYLVAMPEPDGGRADVRS